MKTVPDYKTVVLSVLGEIAPEADLDELEPDANLQDELDIDSVDFLNFVMGVHEKTGIDIAERDYPKVATLASCVAYLEAKAG